MVNTDTLISLQIIQPDTHPNTFNQGPGSSAPKESLSLFGLFQTHARCPQGKAELRRIFLRPSLDSQEIIDRLDFISVFMRPENQASCAALSKSLSKVKNMRTVMALLHKGVDGGKQTQNVFTGGVWASLLAFTYHTIDMADALMDVLGSSQLPLVVQALRVLDRARLHVIGKKVHDVVDLEGSADQHRTVVKHGVNQDLDEIKSFYDGMEDILSIKAIEIARAIPPDLNPPLNVVYFPHLGFHLTVPRDTVTGNPIYCGDELGWKQMFSTPAQAYFKDHNMVEMDHDLGDLYAAICDLEIEISYNLAQTVLEDETLLVTTSDICGSLDCLLALTHVAIQYKLTRPVLVDENVVEIRGGRHLLYELTVPSFVPNDTLLRGGSGHEEDAQRTEKSPNMILLTGPNYSGKSVYQKQVALTVYMAQVGSFVPAEAAILGITDKIFTRITTRESVSRTQSAFMIDMQQMAIALNSCTHRTLVVIDELGKGTDACDGVGLAIGVLNHLQGLGSSMPKAIMATHFHEIFDMVCLGAMEHLSPMQMEVKVRTGRPGHDFGTRDTVAAKNSDQHGSEVTYLYNLRPGRSVASYGIQCAAMNGISPGIVERACQLARLAEGGEDLVLTCSALSASEEGELEIAEDTARQFLAWDLDARGEGRHDQLVSILEESLGIVSEEASDTNVTRLSA
ncbi:hypothetical protein PV10_03688 [Exophiala mesophila]|uniref:DNA mismatch repair protein MSH5 n=1 Tax=Exophiala mesophila TaxID=212818 RepID=A0A0D1XVX1_EXOME|nr:uncharacterized protein PV10_03688 [Exophiala mesophila]KIV92386.1 hypothetical protein PV10_03688 [Exophiala mesophila]